MRRLRFVILLLSLMAISLAITPSTFNIPSAHAVTPKLFVWARDSSGTVHVDNMTDTNLTPGSVFTAGVNITNMGPVSGFDVTVNYAMAPSYFNPPILTGLAGLNNASRAGGMFDPNANGSCGVQDAVTEVLSAPAYQVHLASVYLGSCPSSAAQTGNGLLFTIQFKVFGSNVTSLDIPTTGPSAGQKQQLVTGGPPNFLPVPGIQVSDFIFQNLAGTLPTPQFTYTPSTPFISETVSFMGNSSFVQGSQSQTDRGIKKLIWSWGDAASPVIGNMVNASIVGHEFLLSATQAASGYYPVRLIVFGSDSRLPMRSEQVIYLDPGQIDDIRVAVTVLKTQPHVGEKVPVVVTVGNAGNRNEQVSMNATFDFKGTQVIGSEPNFTLPISQRRIFNYTIDTTNLIPEAFTVTARVSILGNATDAHPLDNVAAIGFTVLPESTPGSVPVYVFAAIGVVAAAAVVAGITLVRRRGREKDTVAE